MVKKQNILGSVSRGSGEYTLLFPLQEKQRMTDKLEDTSLRLKDEMDLYRKIMDKLWQNRHEFQKEKESMQEVRPSTLQKDHMVDVQEFNVTVSFLLQLIDDLRRELEYLQLFKLEMEHPGQGKGLSEFNARTREIEMEHEVKRLKQVHEHSVTKHVVRR